MKILPMFLFIFEDLTWEKIAAGVVGLGVIIWAIKYGIPTQLFTTTNSLLEKRTTERDDALREKDSYKKDNEELEEQIKILRREIIQRIDISQEDQKIIRELRGLHKTE